jgi:tetratricopeptide (TPR) repeat protein
MSKTRSRHAAEPQIHRQPPPAPRVRRGWRIVIAAIVLTAIAGGAVLGDWYYGLPDDAEPQYVGRQSCIQCHQPQHEKWTGSHHDLAMDRATEETVLADFHDAELTHHGITSRMFRREGKFFINTEGPGGKLADFEVKYVLGVTPLQQYMVEFDRPADMPENEVARLQVLRVSWDTKAKKWFHLDPPDVKEKLDPDDDLHWTGIAQRWNNMCADCHTTNLQKNFDVATGVYHTTFSEIDVSCETCHGPGSLHVQLAKAPSLFWDRKQGYALARLKDAKSNLAQVQTCAHCHSRRRIVKSGAVGGCNYYDFFDNELLTSTSYHADGQILDEVYEFGSFIQSKMYHKGVRCTDCHDPHSLGLKFEGNKVCTDCHQHPPAKYDTPAHHQHKAGSAGAQCVNCHMPQTTYMAVDPRRDHSFRVPRPDLSVKLGTPNACTGCHVRDERLPGIGGQEGSRVGPPSEASAGPPQSDLHLPLSRADLKEYADWLRAARDGDADVKQRLSEVDRWADRALDKWYGKARKREPHFAEALHAAREMTPDAPQKLLALLENHNMPAVARATAVRELAAYLEPDSEIQRALTRSLADRDPQIRAAAVLALQTSPSEGLFGTLMPLLDDRARLVRAETAGALVRMPGQQLNSAERQAWNAALDELFARISVDYDRAGGQLMLGNLYQELNEPKNAIAAYQAAIRIEPGTTGARSRLALMYEDQIEESQRRLQQLAQIGDQDAISKELEEVAAMQADVTRLHAEELGLFERDVQFLPDNAGLQATIGLARYRQGWRKEAEHALLTAHLLEPREPLHVYTLAIYYRDTGSPERARELVRLLRRLRPTSEQFATFEQELLQQRPVGPQR